MASKGLMPLSISGRITPVNPRTRAQKAAVHQPHTPPQTAKAMQVVTDLSTARALLASENCLSDEIPLSNHMLSHTLTLIIKKHSTPASHELIKVLMVLEVIIRETKDTTAQQALALEVITQKLGETIASSVQKGIMELSTMIKSSLAEQSKIQVTAAALDATALSLNKVALDMSKSINDTTTATTQCTATVATYKEALLNANPHPAQTPTHPKTTPLNHMDQELNLQLGLDRKARQVLLDSTTGEGHCMNIHELKEKVKVVIKSINPLPPKGTTIQEVMKLKNGSIIIQFNMKEAADWIRVPENEQTSPGVSTPTPASETAFTH
ncbi:hypothetical protein EDB87DRAFT_1579552 [Lactarius vividus]|nr:hypothetical protein EDB87DRAFT_1579552 [Lactarius vividus]